MRTLPFKPIANPGIERIRNYSEYRENPEVALRTDQLLATFRGELEMTLSQASWMGRGCYTQLEDGRSLSVKGTGPGPGSEVVRQFFDSVWKKRSPVGIGGCARVDTGTPLPLLVQFRKDLSNWVAMDPRPEGFAIFGALFREAISSEIYKRLHVSSTNPVQLWRQNIVPPWQDTNTPEGVQDFVRRHLPLAIQEYIEAVGHPMDDMQFEETTYFDMDGGSLIRTARTPYRIANLHTAASQGDEDTLYELAHEMRNCLVNVQVETGRNEPQEKFLALLGESAGKLYRDGVIHGQLHIHFQNVSLAAELADFDSTIFLNAHRETRFTDRLQGTYLKYWDDLLRGESENAISMLPFVKEDFEKYTGLSNGKVDQQVLASYIIGQIYDLYNQATRCADLMKRANIRQNPESGTVLNHEEFQNLRDIFAVSFTGQLTTDDIARFNDELAQGMQRFMEVYLDKRNCTTIYGWHFPSTPIDHMYEKCDEQRQQYLKKDAEELIRTISDHLQGICQ